MGLTESDPRNRNLDLDNIIHEINLRYGARFVVDTKHRIIGNFKKNQTKLETVEIDNKIVKRLPVGCGDTKGVLVATLVTDVDTGEKKIAVGFSMCRTAMEPFRREVGWERAFNRAVAWADRGSRQNTTVKVPHSMRHYFPHFLERCKKYFNKNGENHQFVDWIQTGNYMFSSEPARKTIVCQPWHKMCN